MRRLLLGAAALTVLSGAAVAVGSPALAVPVCDQPVPPPACDDGPDPDPGPYDHRPRGSFDGLGFVGNGVRVIGQATDADRPDAPITVHVSVDNAFAAALDTDAAGHYDGFAPARHGAHTVCVYAISVVPAGLEPAGNPRLGCRTCEIAAVAAVTSYYSNGQWMVGFDDNVVGEPATRAWAAGPTRSRPSPP